MAGNEERFRLSDLTYLIPVMMVLAVALVAMAPIVWITLSLMQTMGVLPALGVVFGLSWFSITGAGLLKWWDATFSCAARRRKWLTILLLAPILGACVFFFIDTERKPQLHLVTKSDPQ